MYVPGRGPAAEGGGTPIGIELLEIGSPASCPGSDWPEGGGTPIGRELVDTGSPACSCPGRGDT